MVPLTIFQRLSSLGSGGGVNADTIPPLTERRRSKAPPRPVLCLFSFYGLRIAFIGDNGHLQW
jgi:hypothetical protein